MLGRNLFRIPCVLGIMFLLLSTGCQQNQQTYKAGEQITLQILHTSDLHGKFINYDYPTDSATTSGSLAAVATRVAKLRQENPLTFLIDTGDTVQDNSNEIFIPTPAKNPMVLAMNAMNYDSWTTGNHEYNFGMDYLKAISGAMKAPTLAANLYKDGKRVFTPYIIVNRQGVRVAIIGMVTPNITRWDSENLKGYTVTMPIDEMGLLWPEIQHKADVFILASHQGLEDEYIAGDGLAKLLEEYKDIHVALAAHSHAVINTQIGAVTVVEPGAQGTYLDRVLINLEKTADGFRIIDIIPENEKIAGVPDDPALVKLTAAAHQQAVADARTVIGHLEGGPLVPDSETKGISQALLQPTALIAFINEVQMYYTKAPVSSAALFRDNANLQPGDITKAGVSFIYKYDNTLRSYEMTGAQLKKYMEWSASYFNTFRPGDLTISFDEAIRLYNYDMFSGVQYDIDISAPVGSRIKNLRWPDGRLVSDTESFLVAVNDYRGKGTLMQEVFPEGDVKLHEDLYDTLGDGSRIRTLIARYIQDVKAGKITNSFDSTLTNFRLTGYSWDKQQHELIVRLINEGQLSLPSSFDGRTPNVRSMTSADLPKN